MPNARHATNVFPCIKASARTARDNEKKKGQWTEMALRSVQKHAGAVQCTVYVKGLRVVASLPLRRPS